MRVLVTGGAGYIGSHTVVELVKSGHDIFVVDNFSNSKAVVFDRLKEITGQTIAYKELDLLDKGALIELCQSFKPEAVIHFAGLKAVGESSQIPVTYYQHNVQGSLNLLEAMDAVGCKHIVFSSSATVYGAAKYLPMDEAHPLEQTNPYARCKYFIEEILRDWVKTGPDLSARLLRYFNPVGAHPSGNIGEDPNGPPNNLVPFLTQVAIGRREKLSIFGDDYDTRDGTGLRDYIHVVDLARAHVAALDFQTSGAHAINIGTGTGSTVMELVNLFGDITGKPVPHEIVARRPGDISACVADTSYANEVLGWTAEHDLRDMCESAWHWQSKNPNGYEKGA